MWGEGIKGEYIVDTGHMEQKVIIDFSLYF